MPTELEMKSEMLAGIPADAHAKCEPELDKWVVTENLDGKPIIQKIYSQWKSGKKGTQNRANVWTVYYLGITCKKPDITKPIFPKRRAFARPSPPDIDSDFDFHRRQEIIDYLVSRYGRYNVGNIGTYGALKMRSALTRIIKALDIANAFKIAPPGQKVDNSEYKTKSVEKVNEILDTLPKSYGAVLKVKNSEGEEIPLLTSKDVIKADSRECDDFRFYMDKYPDIMRHANYIEGLLSIFSVHASGVVLSDIPLQEIAPLRTAKDTGTGTVSLATQFANEDLEYLGLIKFDILGISTLTVMAETLKLIKEHRGYDVDIENLPLDPTNEEAKKTYDLYKSGKLVGVFQCNEKGMQDTCVEVGIDRFEDIMAVISLYRPGPMDNIPDYCDRKHGRKPVSYFHPTIAPFVEKFLSETYGVATYQEQLMRICEFVAGLSLGDGYVIIKGVSKKKIEIIAKNKGLFVAGCVTNGIPKEIADQYWEKFLVPFAGYGFNKAHACCYAYNSFITAFLKANYPEEFMCAYMNVETERRKHDRVTELEHETSRMGITILPRDVNKCNLKWEIVRRKDERNGIAKSEIRPPLHCINMPLIAAENILANRPYNSVRELAEKTDTSAVAAGAIEALCDAKFFKMKKEKLVEEFKTIREDLKSIRKKGRESMNIFDDIE